MAVFGLVDCNNFFVSCERVFAPALANRPVVILSSNDGCVIARSDEAKALGIAMGVPWFKTRALAETNGVAALSSNPGLYGDMSARVMAVLAARAPAIEIYSIDECFLDLTGLPSAGLDAWCRILRDTVLRWTGIPVSVGVGPSRTLAKVANHLAKASARARGVVNLAAHPEWIAPALAKTAVGEVWGIGRRSSRILAASGILTARDLAAAETGWVRKILGATGLRTVLELRGIAVHDGTAADDDPKSRCCTRSFGRPVRDIAEMRDAVSTFAARAAARIRADGLATRAVQVIIETSRFRPDLPAHTGTLAREIAPAAADTRRIAAAALACLQAIWRPGFLYNRAGVILFDLISAEEAARDLFSPPPTGTALMTAVDDLNRRFGSDAVTFGHHPVDAPWHVRRTRRSPAYTTRWSDIPAASADRPRG